MAKRTVYLHNLSYNNNWELTDSRGDMIGTFFSTREAAEAYGASKGWNVVFEEL